VTIAIFRVLASEILAGAGKTGLFLSKPGPSSLKKKGILGKKGGKKTTIRLDSLERKVLTSLCINHGSLWGDSSSVGKEFRPGRRELLGQNVEEV